MSYVSRLLHQQTPSTDYAKHPWQSGPTARATSSLRFHTHHRPHSLNSSCTHHHHLSTLVVCFFQNGYTTELLLRRLRVLQTATGGSPGMPSCRARGQLSSSRRWASALRKPSNCLGWHCEHKGDPCAFHYVQVLCTQANEPRDEDAMEYVDGEYSRQWRRREEASGGKCGRRTFRLYQPFLSS